MFHEMNLSCTLYDPDPKLNLNDFCRSQDQQPACLSRALLTHCSPTSTGVRPIRQHSRWASHPISVSRSGTQCVPMLCRPAQSDRGDEQSQGRSPPPPPPPRQGPLLLPGAARCSSQRLYGERKRGSHRPLQFWSSVGPRPVTAWPAGHRTSHGLGRQHIHGVAMN